MRALKHILLVASIALLPAFSTAYSQAQPLVGGLESNFIKQASLDQVFFVIGGNLAPTHSASPAVRRLASRVVRDTLRDYGQLSTLGLTVNVAVSASTDLDEFSDYKNLITTAGTEFDKIYLQTLVQELKESITLYKDVIKNGKSVLVTVYARRNLPGLQVDLQLAKALAKQLNISLD